MEQHLIHRAVVHREATQNQCIACEYEYEYERCVVYAAPSDGDLLLITEPASLTRYTSQSALIRP